MIDNDNFIYTFFEHNITNNILCTFFNYIIGKRIPYHAVEILQLYASDEEVLDETFSLREIVPAELITIFPSKVFYLQKLWEI